jgi:RNA polymerase sigma factor (sigma-70 family)
MSMPALQRLGHAPSLEGQTRKSRALPGVSTRDTVLRGADHHRGGAAALPASDVGRPCSLDEPDLHGEGSSDRLRFASASGLHEGEFDLIESRLALAPLLAALPERERRILALRFFDGLTRSKIGVQMGISQMYVSRLL